MGGLITPALAREFFEYDAETGILTWKKSPAIGVSAGSVAGNIQRSNGYRYVHFKFKSIRAHRLIWLIVRGSWPSGHIDHINGDRADNRLSNLRDVPREMNSQNERCARKNNQSTGLLGAYKAGSRYRSIIRVAGKPMNLGRFDTAEKAHEAYVFAKRKFHEGCTI